VESLLAQFRAHVANGCYESALLSINNVAAWYYDRNQFEPAMQAYQVLANFADPVTTVDPSDGQDEAIRKSTLIKDMSRNYAKFMLNAQQVRPNLCRTTNCVELAWGMMEKVKSRLLRMDLINSGFSRLGSQQKSEVTKLITRLKNERIARSQFRLATGKLLGPTEKDAVIETLEANVTRYLPEYTNLAGDLASLQRVKDSLTENETLLSFVYTNNERKVYLFRVEKHGAVDPATVVVKTDILTAVLYNAIENVKKSIIAGKSLQEISRGSPGSPGLEGIYEGLLQKLDLPPNRRLIIATDQNLSALPFDLLPWKNGQRMSDVFDINYVPSATVFYYLRSKRFGLTRERNAAYAFDYVGFGYAGEEADSLTHTETEIENAARNFSRAPNLPNASEADIYRRSTEIANSRYLHFATHNYFTEGVDASFYLSFGNDSGQDGHLTSQEIISGLRNRSELTVLSSCETAQANDNYPGGALTSTDPGHSQCAAGILSNCVCSYGESFSNLSGAFFAAGSKQLLLTQWKIPDDSFTGVFISRFFALLSEGKSPSDALKETKNKMSEQRPVVWAGFILAGD
jgi:CHAT domain-containing protein